jgi:putative phage-type endonuclease
MKPQSTDQWKQDRCGVVTASRFSDVLAKIRTGEAAARYNYKAEIIAERLTGIPSEGFTTSAMQWGIDHEDQARAIYEAINDVKVDQTGMIKHSEIEAGASPDGLVGDEGLIEIKCPNTATHIQFLLSRNVPKNYYAQMQGQMWITGRQWCDFVSYDPRLNDRLAFTVQHILRDDKFIEELEREVRLFIQEVEQMILELEK